jgi:hypothetical protein
MIRSIVTRPLSIKAILALDQQYRTARPKRLRFAIFTQCGRVVRHARQLCMPAGDRHPRRAAAVVGAVGGLTIGVALAGEPAGPAGAGVSGSDITNDGGGHGAPDDGGGTAMCTRRVNASASIAITRPPKDQ